MLVNWTACAEISFTGARRCCSARVSLSFKQSIKIVVAWFMYNPASHQAQKVRYSAE